MTRVAIIGGGIAGSAALWQLKSADHDVTLYEASDRLGGVVGTVVKDGFTFETGPNTVPSTGTRIAELIAQVGLSDKVVHSRSETSRRLIYRHGKLHVLPQTPGAMLTTGLMPLSGRLRLFTEPWRKKQLESTDETLAAFCDRRIGRQATQALVDPFVGGVFAGDPRQLGACAFPTLQTMERDHGSLFKALRARRKSGLGKMTLVGLEGGWETLPTTIARQAGNHICLGHSVSALTRTSKGWHLSGDNDEQTFSDSFEAVVLAVPAHVAANLLGTLLPDDSRFLAGIPHPPIAVVGMGYQRSQISHPLDAFGLLCTSDSPVEGAGPILGCLFASSIFADRVPANAVSITMMLGGSRDPEVADQSDATVLQRAQDAASALLGAQGPPDVTSLWRSPRAIPQYAPGHDRAIARLNASLDAYPTLRLAGNYLNGVGLDAAAGSGLDAASALQALS